MVGEWTTRKLADCCDFNPTSLKADWPHARLRYIDISSVGEGIQSEPFKLMLRTNAPSRAQRLVASGDSLLSTVRPNRRSMLWLGSVADNVVASTGFAVLRAKPAAMSSRYLYYTVFNRAFTDYLVTMEKGAAYPAVSVADIGDAEISLPPLAEQKAIAAVLGALDDKIELNRRMNATLEAMARALFQSWFVDFDPVRAKLDGGKPVGLDDAIAAFFPTTFQDSPLGHIPKGWEVRPLADAFDIKDGATFRKEDRLDTGSIIAFGANGPVGFSTRANVSEPCIALGKIGSCGSLHRSWNSCWVTNNAFIVQPPRGGSLEFLWRTLCTIDFSQFIGGSANPYMPLKNFGHTPVVMPPETLLNAYQERAGSLAAKIVANDVQSRTLATLRDTLLPKLLSGELSVASLESKLEAAQ